jgi:hypothetical protein
MCRYCEILRRENIQVMDGAFFADVLLQQSWLKGHLARIKRQSVVWTDLTHWSHIRR